MIKLFESLVDENRHTSKYDDLVDYERLFYAFRNHHHGAKGYFNDAPLYKVAPDFRDINSWQLKKFVTNACQPAELPLKMTFNSKKRSGYCSAYGFARPKESQKSNWTVSKDVRVIFKPEASTIVENETYKIVINFEPYLRKFRKSIDLLVFLDEEEIGRFKIADTKRNSLEIEVLGSQLIGDAELSTLKMTMPNLFSNKQQHINKDTRLLGLLIESIEIK